MRIAVTGATGFVGGHTVRRLLAGGHDVVAYGRRAGSGLPAGRRLDYVRWDIASGPIAAPPVDAVVHCAGSVTEWGSDAQFDAVNRAGTGHVLASFAAAERFVHLSTASVYDLRAHKRDVTEEAPTGRRHLSGYIGSKIAAEELVMASRASAVILRPHIVYGPGEAKILPRLLDVRRLGAIVVPGDGRNRLSVTHVDNLVDAIVAALGRHHGREVFNVADSVTGTVDELLTSLQQAFGLKPRIAHVPVGAAWAAAIAAEAVHRSVLAGRVPRLTRFAVAQLAYDFTLDCGRAADLLAYRPRRTYLDGFAF